MDATDNEENMRQEIQNKADSIKAFLEEHNDFQLIEQKTIFPSIDGGDGFFWAVIKRND